MSGARPMNNWEGILALENYTLPEAAKELSLTQKKCRFCKYLGDPGCFHYPGSCAEHIEKWLKETP